MEGGPPNRSHSTTLRPSRARRGTTGADFAPKTPILSNLRLQRGRRPPSLASYAMQGLRRSVHPPKFNPTREQNIEEQPSETETKKTRSARDGRDPNKSTTDEDDTSEGRTFPASEETWRETKEGANQRKTSKEGDGTPKQHPQKLFLNLTIHHQIGREGISANPSSRAEADLGDATCVYPCGSKAHGSLRKKKPVKGDIKLLFSKAFSI